MGKGQNEGGFSEEQVQMYKDCFKLMDINKDGTLDKNDLRGAFELMGEVGGPCNVMGMVKMFQHALMTWGDKMSKSEIDDIFNEFEIDETTWSRPRRLLASLLLSRKKRRRRRRRKKHLLKLLQRRMKVMPRRRRRRRRRPPSK